MTFFKSDKLIDSNAALFAFSPTAYYDGRWDIRYIRQCAMEGEVGPQEGRWCKERSGTFRVKVKYCHCDNKDGCNAASTTQLQVLTLGPLLMLISTYLASWLKIN